MDKNANESVLNGTKLLIVDDEPDILEIIEEEIRESTSDVQIDKATSFEEAADLLRNREYDLVVLDIMGVRGFDLLDIAVSLKRKTAMLTAHALNLEALKKSHRLGAMAYLPKDKLGDIVPFLEDVLQYEYETSWKKLMSKLGDYYSRKFRTKIDEKLG
ncbi:MAG TPA: response regulator [Syntrophorhabdaceae bacterium]|nr:response regulator [Syntrophorhabdaceae bacterium]